MSNPTLLQMPLAVNGDKNTIPVETGSNTGLFSQKYGFQSINSLPLSAGGKAISRHDYNGAMYLLSNILFYTQKGYTFEFDASQAYYENCEVIDTLDGNKYRCIADVAAEGDNPSEDITHWERIFDESEFFYRLPDTDYALGDVKYAANLPSWGFLICTTAGTSASTELTIPSGTKAGGFVTDGTVTWQVASYANMQTALAEATGYGIVSGCAPSISGLVVTVASGIVHLPSGARRELAAQTVTLATADTTNPRIDLVYLDQNGDVQAITGTAAASPSAPALPSGGISVATVTVAANATTGTVADVPTLKWNTQNGAYKILLSNKCKALPKFGDYLGINGKDSSSTIDSNSLALFKSYGFSILRYDFTWSEVEQSAGVYDFSARIALCQRLKANGMTGYCILDYSNSVYSGYAVGSANWITAFCNAASAYVTALKNAGITGQIFEVYNEPNINDFSMKETEYTNFAQSVYSTIKSVDSTAIVALPALATAEPDGKALPWFKTICRNGILQHADVVSLHPYTVGAPEKFNFDYADGYQQSFKVYNDVISAYSIKKIPVWCGECGSDNANTNLKAAYDARIILNCLANGLDKVILYTSYDDNGNFELFNSDNTPTAAATLIKSLYDELKDYAYYGVYYEANDAMILRFVNEQCNVKYVGWLIDNSSGVVYYKNDAISLTNTPSIIASITPENIAEMQIDYLNTLEPYKIVLGSNNVINAENIIAVGEYNTASADGSLMIGSYNKASNANMILSGTNNHSLANLGIAHGEKNQVGNASIANGYGNVAAQGHGYTILSYSGNVITLDISDNLSVGDTLYIVSTDASLVKTTIAAISTVNVTVDKTPTSNWIFAVKIGELGRHGIITNGVDCMACNAGSYAGGMFSAAYNYRTFAQGEGVVANENNSVAIGSYNSLMGGGDRFVVGSGSAHNVRSNAFRVTASGAAYGQSAYNSTGADYAEYFEWVDGNTDNEDRVAYFVTFDSEDKIRIADSTDDYILGIVSGNPATLGNSYNDQWQNMYVTDDFGRVQYEEVEVADITDGEGNVIVPAHTEKRPVLNPDYDNSQTYVGRENRPEWSAVGMVGVLPVRDDGTCDVNGYCTVADGGIATKANSGYRVIERVSENVVKVVFR